MIKQKLKIIGFYLLIALFFGLLALLIGPKENSSNEGTKKTDLIFLMHKNISK